MKTLTFLFIVLVAGFSSGIIHGLVNLVVVEPFLDRAIGIENQNMFAVGEAQDTPDFWKNFDAYRIWQKQGEVLAGGILGLATGALFGLVFAYSLHSLPSQSYVKKSLVLAGIMWLTLFFIPFLKYPANPPTVGDPNTIIFRDSIYVAFIALSGLGALGISKIYKKMHTPKTRFSLLVGYVVYMIVLFLVMPNNPDPIRAPMDLVNGFRIASASTVTVTWIVNAVMLGLLWKKFLPHIEEQKVL